MEPCLLCISQVCNYNNYATDIMLFDLRILLNFSPDKAERRAGA